MQFLVIEGNIGAGKTTLANKLANEYNAKLIVEQFADNPFLPKFYKNQDRYSFPLELSFLADRYNQIKNEVFNLDLFHSFLIADYYFAKSAIFAQNTLKEDEYRLFRQIFDIVFESMPKPDLYVYLHADTEKLISNIKKRGRDYEQEITPDYLEKIKNGYFHFFKQITSFPMLIIDVNNIDFVNNNDHYQLLKEAVFKTEYKLGINRMLLQ
ncbi:Deoxyadenosine/deoxycytidine kinase [Tangfeifania diversioriginum]|uniref:Deoxyadenosine/deoxycytidine kinase n=1 Tax=Tangfeifania diversioriginum TaxID=1168035 RepID=A0A1M6NBA2_9BACT|nr:deoxynucleoside kinase [Tangfeifania diversioriginum]SHJ92959.1 Deoxyadenosine/deoxycytidine kinase [Tangfeifania diversioriginum]